MYYTECDRCGKAVPTGNIMKKMGSLDHQIKELKAINKSNTYSWKDLETNLCKICFLAKYKNKMDPAFKEVEVEEKVNRRSQK